jgi:hypothetical protein
MPRIGFHCSHEQIPLGGHGYIWLRIRREGERSLS